MILSCGYSSLIYMFCKAKIFFVYSNGFMEKIFILLDILLIMRLCINVDDAVILLVGERSLARKQLTLCIISKVVTVNCSFGTPSLL